jgi:hypothetical protein
MEDIRVSVAFRRNDSSDDVSLRLMRYTREPDGTRKKEIGRVFWEKYTPGEAIISMTLTREEIDDLCQNLAIEHLIKPAEAPGELKATKYHLEDLRSMLQNLIKKRE